MKYKKIRDLKKGEWIISGNKTDRLNGKFKVGRVKEINVTLESYEELDIGKGDIVINGEGIFTGIDGVTQVLNEKEIKALQILRTKLKTLKGLEDDKIKRKY